MKRTMEKLISRALKREAKYREQAEELRMARQEAAAMHNRAGLFNRPATCDRFGHEIEAPAKAYNKPPERPTMSDNVEVAVMLIIGLVSIVGLFIMADAGWISL